MSYPAENGNGDVGWCSVRGFFFFQELRWDGHGEYRIIGWVWYTVGVSDTHVF